KNYRVAPELQIKIFFKGVVNIKRNFYLTILVLAVLFILCNSATNVKAAPPFCGDGKCIGGENADNCPEDCATAVCGDGLKEGSEECDNIDFGGETCLSLGFEGGALSCNVDCTYDSSQCTSGSCVSIPGKCACDGICTSKEQGYVDGGGICGDCDINQPVCGDNLTESPEVCDGTDLGGQTCVTKGYDYGNLACLSNCGGYDTSDCHYDSTGTLQIHYIDVGQGDSEFIITPDGYTLLIDAGEDNKGSSVVSYIQGLGYNKIDYVIASHMHADHLGGLDIVVDALNPDVCYDHGGSYTTTQYDQYVSACSGKRQTLVKNDNINLGPSVTATILQAGYNSDENTKSIVMELTYTNLDLLFGGDCTDTCEATISPGDLEVYKVHHHGSKYSSTQTFLNNILPEVSVIEVGPNSYGHPTQETLDRLTAIGSDIFRTGLDGTVVLTCSDGINYNIGSNSYVAS
ncbi:MAG: MBL fold metallo-hydrolase, partial [Nanoarchaeota archaeon]|nr:MBL fold metallo-hydrolase [Nanoarchaeota archaeon]